MPATVIADLIIDKNYCDLLRNKLSNRTAKMVIESIYTITNLAFNPTSQQLISRLIAVANQLKSIAVDTYAFRQSSFELFCLDAAESLIRAAKQRTANIPPLREYSRIPFDLPAPNVRIYYEACEYIIDSLLGIFNDQHFFNYYVTIDTVDGPKFIGLAVKMPAHRLLDPSVYTALSHEAFHIYFAKNKSDLLIEPKIQNFVYSGNITTHPNEELSRTKLIEEITVESLDFCFSYLTIFDHYIEDEWTFFGQHFSDAIKINIDPDRLIRYFLRTFSVFLLSESVKQNERPSLIISIRPELRRLLEKHVDKAKAIWEKTFKNTRHDPYLYNIIHKLQSDIEGLSDELDIICASVTKIVKMYANKIRDMKTFLNETDNIDMVKAICKGNVFNKKIEYPHLIVHMLTREVRNNGFGPNSTDRATQALILTIWNSMNLSNNIQQTEQ